MKLLYRNVYGLTGEHYVLGCRTFRSKKAASKATAHFGPPASWYGIETIAVAPDGRKTVVIFEPRKTK